MVRFYVKISTEFARFRGRNVRLARLLWLVSATMLAFLAFGCGSPTANLEIIAPSGAIAGMPFTITVTAMVNGRRDTAYNSPIHFSSSDSAAVLPFNYGFTAADEGSHTFTIALKSPGNQSVKATDVFAATLTATANITVSAATAADGY